MKRGAFITLYGINNIGKSTHAKRLVERLQNEGYDAVYIKYPIYDLKPTGPQINTILRTQEKQAVSEEELQTLFMQNRKDYEPTLQKMLDDGKIVVAEDYSQTGIAWGTAKGLDEKWVEALNKDLLKEDFTLLIVGERVLSAREDNHLHESNDELIARVDEILRRRAQMEKWTIIELQPQKDDTSALVWDATSNFLREFGSRIS